MRIVKVDLRGIAACGGLASSGDRSTTGDVQDGDQVSSEAVTGWCSRGRLRTATGEGVVEERGPGLSGQADRAVE